MKHIALFFAVLFVSAATNAQTLVPKDTANQYFANCLKTSTAGLSAEGQKALCACTAARMTQFFTMEDMNAMMASDPAIARPAYNRMMVDVYAPCMGVPARERYYARCDKTSGIQQQICTCTADKIAMHLQNNGSQIFSNILAINATIEDPWAALENDPAYNNFIDTAGQSCTPQ